MEEEAADGKEGETGIKTPGKIKPRHQL